MTPSVCHGMEWHGTAWYDYTHRRARSSKHGLLPETVPLAEYIVTHNTLYGRLDLFESSAPNFQLIRPFAAEKTVIVNLVFH